MLLYGKEIREKMKIQFVEWSKNKRLELVIIRSGEDPASEMFLSGIKKFAASANVTLNVISFPVDVVQERLASTLKELSQDPYVQGVMLLKPFHSGIRIPRLIEHLDPTKDVEGIHPTNLGRLMSRETGVRPITPKSVMRILREHRVDLVGRKVTVIGRSLTVGLPLSLMLLHEHALVTICHSKARDLAEFTRKADIIITATGQPGLITPDMVSPEAVLVDVGTSVDSCGKLVGDSCPEAKQKARLATAVPGGVGALTVAELFDNLRTLVELYHEKP